MPTIGFSNLDDNNPFAVQVRENLIRAASEYPDIELIVRNNDLDTDKAKRHAQEFAEKGVDAAIIYHIDERAGPEVGKPLFARSIPVISVDIPIEMTTFFGINNARAGEIAGRYFADWINANWHGEIEKTLVLTEFRVLDVVRQRHSSALEQLAAHVQSFSPNSVLYIDSNAEPDVFLDRVDQVMRRWENMHHIAVVAAYDKLASIGLNALETLGRSEDVAMLSFDGTPWAIRELQRTNSPLLVSPSFQPDEYGKGLIDLALALIAKERVPRQNYVEPVLITRENVREFIS